MKLGALLVLCAAVSSGATESETPAAAPCAFALVPPTDFVSLTKESGSIHNRSLSPWRWRSSKVRNRIPATIWEAECTSSVCSSPFPGHQGGQYLNSVPVYQTVLVLTRQERGSCYVASYKSVAVGCTCVLARYN
ncbi:interleukin 17a/f2 [Betta splendens]|uniref:Interleukin 17a/f2 n=1 Tax=Betta splendens TaxID=158456 RepID=A0A6P7LYD7_BETSP|nr:interleukin 17a/f2 [Betta splendens]